MESGITMPSITSLANFSWGKGVFCFCQNKTIVEGVVIVANSISIVFLFRNKRFTSTSKLYINALSLGKPEIKYLFLWHWPFIFGVMKQQNIINMTLSHSSGYRKCHSSNWFQLQYIWLWIWNKYPKYKI